MKRFLAVMVVLGFVFVSSGASGDIITPQGDKIDISG